MPHSEDEVEQSLIVGTSSTTPPIGELELEYPRPWLFSFGHGVDFAVL